MNDFYNLSMVSKIKWGVTSLYVTMNLSYSSLEVMSQNRKKLKMILYLTKAMISGLRCVNEGHEFLKKT